MYKRKCEHEQCGDWSTCIAYCSCIKCFENKVRKETAKQIFDNLDKIIHGGKNKKQSEVLNDNEWIIDYTEFEKERKNW